MSLFFGLTLKEPEDPLSRLDNDDIVPEALNNVSPALAQIILKGGAVRSDERFQSAEDMLSAMESCGTAPEPVNISECTVSEPFAPAPAKTYRKSKRKPLLACGIFLGAAAAIAAAVKCPKRCCLRKTGCPFPKARQGMKGRLYNCR